MCETRGRRRPISPEGPFASPAPSLKSSTSMQDTDSQSRNGGREGVRGGKGEGEGWRKERRRREEGEGKGEEERGWRYEDMEKKTRRRKRERNVEENNTVGKHGGLGKNRREGMFIYMHVERISIHTQSEKIIS